MIRSVLRSALPFLTLVLPFAASANTMPGPGGTSAWTIYAFANGDVIFNVLQSASALVANAEFRNFLLFISTLAVLGTAVVASMTGQWRKLAMVVMAITFMTTAGMSVTTNVMVDDPVTGYDNVVSNVPMIVAIPESVVSTIGHEMAYLADEFFSLPNNLTATGGGGFNLATSILRDSTQVTIVDPQIRATLAAFASNCIVPSIVAARYSPYALVQSPQLFGSGGTLSAGLQAPITLAYSDQSPQGVPVPCGKNGAGAGSNTVSSTKYAGGSPYSDAYDYLSDALAEGAPSWLGSSAGALQGTAAYSWISTELTSAQSYLFNGQLTQSTGETIEQAAAINALNPALNQAAIASGQSEMVSALAVAQGEKTQISSWATAVALFTDLAGYIYSVLQAFLVALTPVLLASAFMPGVGWKMVMSYVKICLWLAMWMPIMSMISFIVSVYAQSQLPATLGGSGGYSMLSMTAVSSATEHLVLAAGFLATLTPLITWAIVNGTFAFTEFLAEGLGHKMASLAGSIAATGNVSLDNQQFRNTTLDQQMLATKTTAGNQAATNYSAMSGGAQDILSGGGAALENASGRSSVSTQAANSAQAFQSFQRMRTASNSAQSSIDDAIKAGVSLDKTITESAGHGVTGGTRTDASSNSRMGQQVDESVQAGLRTMESQGYDTSAVKRDLMSGNMSPTEFGVGLAALAGGRGAGGLGKLAAQGGKWARVADAFSKAGGAVSARLGEQKDFSNTISNKGSTESSAGRDVSSSESASSDRSAALSRAASDVFTSESNYASRVSQSAGEDARRAASMTQQASQSFAEVSQAQRSLSESVQRSLPVSVDASTVMGWGSADSGVKTLPAPGSVRGQVDQAQSQVEKRVAGTDALNVDAGSTVRAGEGAAGRAGSLTSSAGSQISGANRELSGFEDGQANIRGQAAAQTAAANDAANQTRDAAAGKRTAVNDKALLGLDQTQANERFNEGRVQKGQDGLSPEVVLPSGVRGAGKDALEVAAGGAAVGGAKQAAADYVLRKAAGAVAGEAIEGTAATAGAAGASGTAVVGGTAATGAEATATGLILPEVLAGTAAAGTGLYVGDMLNRGANYAFGWHNPTLSDAAETGQIKMTPGVVAKEPSMPSASDLSGRSATSLSDEDAVKLMDDRNKNPGAYKPGADPFSPRQ